MQTKLISLCLISTLLWATATVGLAQEGTDGKTNPKLPAHPAAWINSPPGDHQNELIF